jgi:hypothetical protein
LVIDIVLVLFLVYYKNLFNKLFTIDKEEDLQTTEDKVKQSTEKLTSILTDSVSMEDEESI